MNKYEIILNFMRHNGREMSEINEGSDEIALPIDRAFEVLQIAEQHSIPIIGGDIITETKQGMMAYAYTIWGTGYHYLNWSCDKTILEQNEEYCKRSHELAREMILEACLVSTKLNYKCYIVFVI